MRQINAPCAEFWCLSNGFALRRIKIWVCCISPVKANTHLLTYNPLAFTTRRWLHFLKEGMGRKSYPKTLASNLSCCFLFSATFLRISTNRCKEPTHAKHFNMGDTLKYAIKYTCNQYTRCFSVFFTKFCLFLGNCFCIQSWHEFDKIRTLQK